MKLHVLLNLYNDRIFLSAMLDSIKNDVDSIIIADGAYELYYKDYKYFNLDAEPYSTDGSLEIIQALHGLPPLKILRCPDNKPWLNQCVKRNALVKEVPNDDWFIVMDADTMLFGDIPAGLKQIEESGCAVAHVPVYNVGLDRDRMKPYWHPQLFLKMPGMHYFGTHWLLRDAYNRVIESTYPLKWISDFIMVHLKWLKPHDRLRPHQEYMKRMSGLGWRELEKPELKV